jgi:hypothetical protein
MDQALTSRLLEALVGRPIVSNAFRGTLVEAILATVLEPTWRWCADGWGSFDFEGPDGIGLEVKQSAARQDWHDDACKPCTGRFDIAARTGRWDGKNWVVAPGRSAKIYVFAWHPQFDPALADHRKASQWEFYPVLTERLPPQKSIGLAGIRPLAQSVGIADVAGTVARLCRI